jgi:hypothetical protein
MLKKALPTVVGAAVLGLAIASPATAQDAGGCFTASTLKVSFHVVFPNARQITMDGDAARAYLAAYNTFGNPTDFKGDTLFLNIMPNGTTMIVPLIAGQGCQRMVVGPKLHRMIMAKVERGSV